MEKRAMKIISFGERLNIAVQALCGNVPAAAGTDDPVPVVDTDPRLLEMEAKAKSLSLDLEEARKLADSLRRELDYERNSRAEAVASSLAATLEPSMKDAVPYLGQLSLQALLLDKGTPVAAKDVMALARALAKVFEKQGLCPASNPGETVSYDPALHTIQGGAIQPGAAVKICIPGYTFRGKLLKKALVEVS